MNEPLLHTGITDTLPDGHPLAWTSVSCSNVSCNEWLHASNNENLRGWVETGRGPFCLRCFQGAVRTAGRCPVSRLSPRELAVLCAAAHGLSQRQTAEQLHIGRSAGRRAILAAIDRLGAASLPHAVALAMRHQFISANDIPDGTTT